MIREMRISECWTVLSFLPSRLSMLRARRDSAEPIDTDSSCNWLDLAPETGKREESSSSPQPSAPCSPVVRFTAPGGSCGRVLMYDHRLLIYRTSWQREVGDEGGRGEKALLEFMGMDCSEEAFWCSARHPLWWADDSSLLISSSPLILLLCSWFQCNKVQN